MIIGHIIKEKKNIIFQLHIKDASEHSVSMENIL